MAVQHACASWHWTPPALALAVVLLAGLCTVVRGGAVFETQKPVLPSADDYRVIFKPITPPNNPATIRAGATAFNQTALQMRLVTIEKCGVIAAHIHPRATEWGYVIKGAIEFVMFREDGSRLNVTYPAGQGVVIPQGTVHYARNAACTPSDIVVIFDHPEPAVVYVGQALTTFSQTYLKSAFTGGTPNGITGNQFYLQPCTCDSAYGGEAD